MSRLFADIIDENQEPKGQRLFENIVNETEPQNVEKEVETTKQPTRLFADIVEPTKTLTGGVKKNVRDYSTRFEDRPNKFAYNLKEFQEDTDKTPLDYAKVGLSAITDIPSGFVSNFGKDVKDTVTGLAQITGNALYNAPVVGARNLMRVAKGDIQNVGDYLNYIGQDTKEAVDTLKQTPEFLNNVKEGLKEAYGQKGIDIISDKGINLDVPGLVQSYYAHPLNLLDIVGAGEVGKLGTVAKTSKIKPIAKAGETVSEALQKGNYSKQVGNKVLKPQYSENLVINAGQRLAESKPVQSFINAIDESGLRPGTDVVADFLGLSPESRLLGEKGAAVRQTKLLEQKNQVKNIAERNEAIAKNKELLSGLNEAEAKELIDYVETGGKDFIAGKKGKIKAIDKNLLSDEQIKVKNALQEKANQNAEFYIKNNLLKAETVEELPVNTYASIKYNKPITELSEAEKLDGLKDIQKMPDEQKPFYIPMMFDDKLRASDFFASSTKRYKPGELKQRKVGMGLEENKTGGKRVYDPVELANRIDAHRIKLVNTEKMINEVIDNFAKPLDLKNEKVLDGYVPFNPDSFLKFYRGAIDLNEATLRKIEELGNIDTALKEAIQEAIAKMPDDVVEYLGVTKNNKIYQIPQEVADTLMSGKNKKGLAGSMYDMLTAGFKRKVLGMSPKWFMNNRIGNGIMAGLKGVLPQDYIRALNKDIDKYIPKEILGNSLYEAEKTIIGRTGGGDRGAFGNTMRFLGGEFIDTSELKGMQKAINALALPGKAINTITDAMFAFNQKFETLERKATYLRNVDKIGKKMIKTTGQNIVKQEELLKYVSDNPELLEQAIKGVDDTLGDYINMTAVERRVIRKIVPFYSWFRTITRYTLSLAETNPIRADLVNKLMQISAEDREDLPEYQRGSVDTGYYGDVTGKPLVVNYEHSIPFSTFADTADNPTGVLNPNITRLLEASRGEKFFMGTPYTSPNYENVFPYGYASIDPLNPGEFTDKLPLGERLKSIPIGIARSSVPGLEFLERAGIGGLYNLANQGELKPFDALFDTGLGGYNYQDFYSNPKGFSPSEQALRWLLPLQQVGKPKKYVKIKRDIKR